MPADPDTRAGALKLLRQHLESMHHDFVRDSNQRRYEIEAMLALVAVLERAG